MDDPEFNKLLEQLHQEIEHTDNVGDKEKALLLDLSGDIRKLIDRSDGDQKQPIPTTVERLEASIDLLEISHPNLTALMSRLLAVLSNAGI
jgi:Domain of unknown function (DUF4404)